MLTLKQLQHAIHLYDINKGWGRKYFHRPDHGRHPAINALATYATELAKESCVVVDNTRLASIFKENHTIFGRASYEACFSLMPTYFGKKLAPESSQNFVTALTERQDCLSNEHAESEQANEAISTLKARAVQSVKERLSGDKDRISTEQIIQAVSDALALNEPNAMGEAWYTFQGKRLAQTPLIMTLVKIHSCTEATGSKKAELEFLAERLLNAGADVFHAANFHGSYNNSAWPVDWGINTCFNLILTHLPTLLHHLQPQLLQASVSDVFASLRAAIKWTSVINSEIHLQILELLTSIPDEREIHNYLFDILLAYKKACLINDAETQVNLSHLVMRIMGKLPRDSLVLSTFNKSWLNQDLQSWIKVFPESIDWDDFEKFLNKNILPVDQYNAYFSQLMKQKLIHNVYKLKKFDVRGHVTRENWQNTTQALIASKSVRFLPQKAIVGSLVFSDTLLNDIKHRIDQNALIFLKFLGRTLLFEDVMTGDITALKVQKKSEDFSELEKEAATLNGLQARGDLQSALPYPIGLARNCSRTELLHCIPDDQFLKEQAQFEQMTGDTETLGVYCYHVKAADKGYFTYLHEPTLSDEEFNGACRRAIYDLTLLLKQNGLVFHQLADIFHTSTSVTRRTDQGRYLVLAKLIRRFYEVDHSGRVDKWQEAVEFVNLRLTGLADVGDSQLFSDYKHSPIFQEITQPFRDASASYPASPVADELIYANLIAEYLFIFTLVSGRRGVALMHAFPQMDKDQLWLKLAQQVLCNAALFLSELTGIAEKTASSHIETCVSAAVLAKQMAYWMTTNYGKNPTPKEAFEEMYPGADVSAVRDGPLGKSGIGFSHDGQHQDLGDYNCQNPMKEDIKLYYFVSSLIRLFTDMAGQYRESSVDFEEAIKTKRFDVANQALISLSRNSYPHAIWQSNNNFRKKIKLASLIKQATVITDLTPTYN